MIGKHLRAAFAALACAALMGCVTPMQAASTPQLIAVRENGLLGNYYPGRGVVRGPALLVLGGSEGGLSPGQARTAQALNEQGYAVLHLAYFRLPGLPEELKEIPLEYFDKALAWLRNRPEVDSERIGLVAVSKGAEAALVMATRDPAIRAVVLGAPSSQVWIAVESCGVDQSSSWSANGIPLPALNCGQGSGVNDALSAYATALAGADQRPDTAIAIERSNARFLLICGEADSLSPACPMARRLVTRGRPGSVRLLAYPNAGHAGFGVPIARDDPNYGRLAAIGGTPEGNGEAREDSWPKLLEFLKDTL